MFSLKSNLLVRSLFVAALGTFCLIPQALFAAEKISQNKKVLPEVVVKAKEEKRSITSDSFEGAWESMNRIPGGVDLIRAEDYKKGRSSTLQDVLGYSPGVFVQPRYGSEESRLSIRGSGIQRTFHLRGIKLLQDGVPVNQADGGADFQSIEPLAFKYVEVYRGANALRYGSTTLGGAVNFVTPTGYDAPLIQARFEGGGFQYWKSQISSGEVVGPADYYISGTFYDQDGFRNHADQTNKRILSNVGIRFDDNLETRVYVTLADSKSKLPGALTKAQLRDNPKQAGLAQVAGNQKRDIEYLRLAHKTTYRDDVHLLELSTYWVSTRLFHPIFQLLELKTHDLGGMIRYQNEATIQEHRNIFTLGFNPVFGYISDIRHVNAGGQAGALTADVRHRHYNLEFFAEDQFYLLPSLALVSGIQWTISSRNLRDRFGSNGDQSGHPVYKQLSPKVGLRYELNDKSQVFANFSRSFEPPSSGELTGVATGGIIDLKEQTASTAEFGTRGDLNRVSWDLAYYFSWLENELLSLNDPFGNPLGTVNAADTHHQGVELGASVSLLENLLFQEDQEAQKAGDQMVLHCIYNWSRFVFAEDPTFSGQHLPGIPEHFLRLELLYEEPHGFYFGPNLEWSWKKYPVDMANTLFTDAYALLGLKAGYRTEKGFSIFIEAKNLTNEVYAATTGVIASANGADFAQFFPGDGRSVVSGVEFRWG